MHHLYFKDYDLFTRACRHDGGDPASRDDTNKKLQDESEGTLSLDNFKNGVYKHKPYELLENSLEVNEAEVALYAYNNIHLFIGYQQEEYKSLKEEVEKNLSPFTPLGMINSQELAQQIQGLSAVLKDENPKLDEKQIEDFSNEFNSIKSKRLPKNFVHEVNEWKQYIKNMLSNIVGDNTEHYKWIIPQTDILENDFAKLIIMGVVFADCEHVYKVIHTGLVAKFAGSQDRFNIQQVNRYLFLNMLKRFLWFYDYNLTLAGIMNASLPKIKAQSIVILGNSK